MKCAVVPCLGLGDGLISLVLSHNLVQSGHSADTYHPLLPQLQDFFPNLAFFERKKIFSKLKEYDRIFIFYEKLEWMQSLIQYARQHMYRKLLILNPIATPNRDYPFWENGQFDGTIPFVDNLVTFCKNILHLRHSEKNNGMILPKTFIVKKHPNRVVIHPTSSRKGKNWSKEKYLQLANKLSEADFDPVFILTEEEKEEWKEIDAPSFHNLYILTQFIAESGWMIGNDSGIGHLASCIGLPTLTICRSKPAADFWRPAFSEGKVISPPKWIPNIKKFRLRDQKWQQFISVNKVFSTFLQLSKSSVLSH